MKRVLLLLGDSIRMGMQDKVAEALGPGWTVVGPEDNCGDTRRHLERLDAWTEGLHPDVVQINAGLHDLKVTPGTGAFQVPLAQYAANLPVIFARLRELAPQARLIWATTTPVVEERHQSSKRDFHRYNADIDRYNQTAAAAARAAGLEINDLHAAVTAAGIDDCICGDGVHMTDAGNDVLAAAVAHFIRKGS
ncbi:MAG: hypothetical protein BIFFINMI_03955 [Phycisphaerae bacterium]|nr:hypothetical protein [Phycisphaerae bacterium]